MKSRRKIIFYGDSNTYGYDPAEMVTARYPSDVRWTDLTASRLADEWEVIPQGMNGRRLPEREYDFMRIKEMAASLAERDIFAVMLGTNDLILTQRVDARPALARMEHFLTVLTGLLSPGQILVIAPVRIGTEISGDPQHRLWWEESGRLNEGYKVLAEKYGVLFCDAATWQIPLAFDLVHFTEEGSRRFADKMTDFLINCS